jgi:NAD(P)-dependent dehydrogenase (short-subunit alcohol dehydrogenase family)
VLVIVNIASAAAFGPSTTLPAYATTKATVRMFSECLRADLAETGIGVTAICPGITSTLLAHSVRYVGFSADAEERLREAGIRALRRRRFPLHPDRAASPWLGQPEGAGDGWAGDGWAGDRLSP